MELSLRDHSEHVDYINNELTLFATSIARKGWQIRGTTPTDGNCAFWAISDQLDRTGGHPYTQTQLRENVVEYIENLSENDKENLAKFLTQSMDSYLHGMRLNGTYADHICLQSLCKMLSMDILVVNSGDDIRLQPTGTSSKTLVLGHLPDLQHYVSLEPLKRFELDDFVAVHLTGDKHRRVYVAKVLDVDENDVKLKFMKQTRSADVFEWPNKEDIAWQPHSDVWCKFDQPELLPGRGLRMKFDMKGLS
ncbi:uncharacterized protein LOC123551226 [Mercenaria mercenaria]|uniref:uncharacterized protein LOC123551226 n=1 Tax=Mercenaria mercenaria TaxID=6596 RepID=UPI001E1DC497|nr:uncharacterized protein LOC123551226 [Mercenaria mercenaria]